ncbi:MAG: hypothetical protein JNM42_14780 [Propionivibrio sp.]|uniref:hypothetical protein n=1 Tax=Propionivibrio sp. TaxID=2212460 RepID=UPI001A4318C7|nr:hypothetical protein [Propionivibrio sp.]MBL8415702.1 hypothetical protein [Propionivibrio sp.]
MSPFQPALLALAALTISSLAFAVGPDFTGNWTIDLRSPAERKRNVECGNAAFVLQQAGDRITGDHTMATVGCGRQNEGGEGTVKGVIVGTTAVLVVTSGRNGAIAMGTAKLKNGFLHWHLLEEIKAGEPEGDSPLILGRGVLAR